MAIIGRRRLHATLATLVTLVTAGAFAVVPAQESSAANYLRCKWANRAITYYTSTVHTGGYQAFSGAASDWAGVDAMLTRVTSSPNFYALAENRGNTVVWTGIIRAHNTVQGAPPCGTTNRWTSGQMDAVLNWSLMDGYGYTATHRRMVAAHEMGHSFGLAHNSATVPGSPGTPVALMYPYDQNRIQYGIFTPQADDRSGVNALY